MRKRISITVLSALLLFLPAPPLAAQGEPAMKQVLDRLERLERENRALADELRKLRSEIAGLSALEEKMDI
ncbi:MAG: hypothetical protein EXQ52_05910 [Bryobacterales bacterium]|nr:hypothetical protein [Bryobacterales bacterium]